MEIIAEDQITFQKVSALDLLFKKSEFDAILSNFVYHEVRDTRDKREFINESLQVLKKGGNFPYKVPF